jgi:hypothetical protein
LNAGGGKEKLFVMTMKLAKPVAAGIDPCRPREGVAVRWLATPIGDD